MSASAFTIGVPRRPTRSAGGRWRSLGRWNARPATDALRALSEKRYTRPGAETSRTFEVPTLETRLYPAREHGLEGLRPKPRTDQGYAQQLTEEQRKLLLDIRREDPKVSVPVIMRTLINDGRLESDLVSEPTVRRLYATHGLDRATLRRSDGERRLRWVAEAPGQLYHADVCHGPSLRVGKRVVPIRIHAIFDDASRFIVALKVASNEREIEMFELLVPAIRRHDGTPRALYLDNGSTYSGDVRSPTPPRESDDAPRWLLGVSTIFKPDVGPCPIEADGVGYILGYIEQKRAPHWRPLSLRIVYSGAKTLPS